MDKDTKIAVRILICWLCLVVLGLYIRDSEAQDMKATCDFNPGNSSACPSESVFKDKESNKKGPKYYFPKYQEAPARGYYSNGTYIYTPKDNCYSALGCDTSKDNEE